MIPYMNLVFKKEAFLLLNVCFISALFISCHHDEYEMAWAAADYLPHIDSSSIKKGRLENMDVLKGIDNWRLGMPKEYYRGAFYDDSSFRSDTCVVPHVVMNLHENSKATLVFKDDTLSAIRLSMHSHNIRVLIRRLLDLYGEPNVKPFTLEFMSDSTVIFQPSSGISDLKQYMETPKDVFDSVTTYNGPPIPLYKDNIMHFSHFRETKWPDSTTFRPATTFSYYPSMHILASWKSKRSVKLDIFREAVLRPYRSDDSALHIIHIDYYVALTMQ